MSFWPPQNLPPEFSAIRTRSSRTRRESFADIFNSLVVWRGIVVAAEPPDEEHPYGHSKAEPLAAAFGAVMLLLAALWIAGKAAFDIYEFLNPSGSEFHREPLRWFTLIVLVVVIVVKEGLFRFVIGEGEATDNSAVKTDAWHHRSDAITSSGAFIGITIALIGGEKFSWADDAAAIFCARASSASTAGCCCVRR